MTAAPPPAPGHAAPGAGDALASDASPEPILAVEDVTRTYPGEPPVQALRTVSLTVARAELVAVVGPSGSGKTTLLQIMGTLDRPTTGRVRVTGVDTASAGDDELADLRATRIGFIFQQFFLAEHATVRDNVADGLLYAGTPVGQRRERAVAALERVGLAERADARPTELSGGQRQRVAIARALIGEPAIVLADEPTGSLDQSTGQAILTLLGELRRSGSAIVLITHDHAIAESLPRRVEILDGRIVSDRSASRSARPLAGRPGPPLDGGRGANATRDPQGAW